MLKKDDKKNEKKGEKEMKRTGQRAPKIEFASGAVILFSVFLSLFINYLGVLDTREAAQTAAGVQQGPEEYTQLSDPLLVLVNDQIPLPEDWTPSQTARRSKTPASPPRWRRPAWAVLSMPTL